jgi:hypothetical protein
MTVMRCAPEQCTTGACVLILDEAEATAMRDTLSEWLR